MWLNRLLFQLPNSRTTQMSLPLPCSSNMSNPINSYFINKIEILCLFAGAVHVLPSREKQKEQSKDKGRRQTC